MKDLFKTRKRREPGRDEPTRFFVHIPKTAGTSFRAAAESRFGRSRVLRDYGLDSNATSDSVREEVYLKKDNSGIERAIARDNAVLVAGHVPVTKYGSQLGLPNTIAFFRDPVQQVISHYRHAVRNQGFEDGLLAFARLESSRNIQSRLMAGVDPALLGIVGLTEQYRETLAIVNHCWSWDLRHVKKNVGGRLRLRLLEINARTRERLERLNESDRALYERARQVFKNSLYCLEHRVERDPRGAITLADSRSGVRGWALEMGSDAPVEINIRINGRVHSRTHCDLAVSELSRWRLPREGCVGFRAKNVTLSHGDSVEIRDVRQGLVLARYRVHDDA